MFDFKLQQDWDQVSAYSGRSIPRPRIYPMDNQIADDLRSHASHFSALGQKVGKARSIADGQSQHSFSNHSQRGYLGTAFPSNLVNSRPGKRIFFVDKIRKIFNLFLFVRITTITSIISGSIRTNVTCIICWLNSWTWTST